MHELIKRLLEDHRPIKQTSPIYPGGLYLIHCKVCDGQDRHIWAEGDDDVECEVWRENSYRLEVNE